MCLYPIQVNNPKYKANKKNGGRIPALRDQRLLTVPVPCGNCMECRANKARSWRVRLCEEIKQPGRAHFVTLTFNTKSLIDLSTEIQEADKTIYGYKLDNAIATLAIRRFRMRWKKKFGKSIKHWLVTELGKENTEHIHLHGFLWTENPQEINNIWGYGYTHVGTYTNERTIAYCTKYVLKVDPKHKHYRPIILTTPGIGKAYLHTPHAALNTYKGEQTRLHYTTRQGIRLNMPRYLRNKLYTDEQREALWITQLDKGNRYILGQEVNINDKDRRYTVILHNAKAKNSRLGYGSNRNDPIEYLRENQRRAKLQEQRKREHLDNKPRKE
ncbi:MAG: replication initiator protein [Microviridae sp.]|nr:MAG: replication initiator protein [Microviridae sp.]